MLVRPHHPHLEQLTDLAEDRLGEVKRGLVLRHVETCEECAVTLSWLRTTISAMRADDTEAPPPYVVARAQRLFRSRALDHEPAAPRLRQRIAAVLRFDSNQAPLALGVRAAGGAARQILYTAEPFELDLRATPVQGRWQLAGQVLGPGPELGGDVQLSGAHTAVVAPVNDQLEFRLPPVPAGRYELRVRLGSADIDISPVELGP